MTPEQFGPYLLLKKLAEDPLGEVFRAGRIGQLGMEQVVLLRVFNGSALEGHDLATLITGRRTIQDALKSPNIGNGVDLGQVQGLPYAAYDYISGKSLRFLLDQVVKRSYPVPADHALLIAERLALGLAVAYETRSESERILHGFLVPHLVMLSNEGENKILGFEVGQGLRQLTSRSASLLDAFGRYLSPEVRSGSAPSKSDDIYSLGVILLELLLGHAPPPLADGVQGQIQRVVEQGAPDVARLIQKSLAPSGERISDIVTWHKTLSKILVDGHHKSTTFNLAFFMHSLFRDEIERESQELEAERRIEVYASRDPSARPQGAAPTVEPWILAGSADVTGSYPRVPPTAGAVAEAAPRFDPIPSPERPGSASGAITLPPLEGLPPLSQSGARPAGGSGTFPLSPPTRPLETRPSGRPVLIALGLAIGLVAAGAGGWWLWDYLGRGRSAQTPPGSATGATSTAVPYTPLGYGDERRSAAGLESTVPWSEPRTEELLEPEPARPQEGAPSEESVASDPLVRQLDSMVEERTRAVETALRAQYDREIRELRQQIEEARQGGERASAPAPTPADEPAASRAEAGSAARPAGDLPSATASAAPESSESSPSSPSPSAPAESTPGAAGAPVDARAATRPVQQAPRETETPGGSGTATRSLEAPSPSVSPPSPASSVPDAAGNRAVSADSASPGALTSRTPRVRRGELVSPGPGVVPPQLLQVPKPRYPEFARRTRREGVVTLEVLVDENGLVRDLRLDEPVGYGFDEAAAQAARKAEFEPATKDGVEVKMWTRLRIAFRNE